MNLITVTPCLYIDRSLAKTSAIGIATAALRLRAGRRVYVSDEHAAWLVLSLLGLSDEACDDRVHFALTGEVLSPS